MLRIHFGSRPDEIYNTEIYYENQYDKDWVMDEFVLELSEILMILWLFHRM